jgi:hypothetical protein
MKTGVKKPGKKSEQAVTAAAPGAGGEVRPNVAPTKLETLATEIRSGHGRCVEALRGVASQAAAIGALLAEAKVLVGHGGWQAWVGENCRFAVRMAQNYMLVARHHDRIAAEFGTEATGLTLTDFIALAHKYEHARRGTPPASPPKVEPDPFRLPADAVEERRRLFRAEDRGRGVERVAKEKAVAAFVREKVDALYVAVRRFVGSKEAKALAADGLDATDIGMLLVDSLKAALDPVGVFVPQPKAEPAVAPASQPPAGEGARFSANGKPHADLTP